MHPDQFYRDGALVRSACHVMPKEDNDAIAEPPKHKLKGYDPDKDGPVRSFGANFDQNDNRTAGHFAIPDGPCDSPYSLINATFEYIEKVWKDKIDFIVWTGDNIRHDSDNQYPRSPSHIYESNKHIRDKFYKIFKPDNPLYPLSIPIVPSYGNNDVWPHNIFSPGPNYQTRSYASLWRDMIPEYEMHTFERGGYFATEVVPNKLAVISLNTLYWFGSNAAVDGCDRKSEPGTQQFEWLRVQLTEYRKRGVKAYMTGHVPPGRKFYYPSCFRRYAIWSHSFRDVILGHFYGHNNMDHFFFLDAKKALQEEEEAELLKRMHDDDFDFSALSEKEQVVFTRLSTKSPSTLLDSDQNFNILGAEEYLTDLKDMFEAIKRPPIPHKWKGKKDRKNWKKKVREYEENYQVVQVAPSIIPAYYSAIRVFEYNVSELAGTQFRRGNQQPIIRTNWTEWWSQMDRQIEDERLQEHDDLTIQNVDVGDGDIYPLPDNLDSPSRRRRNRKSRHGPIKKKTKKHPPSLHIPDGPHKSAPRGPIYDSQLFTPLRWEVHFVNLTEMNAKYENNPSKSWDYGKDFFKMEYTSDAAPYNLKDLTVGAWLDLGRKIGKEKEIKKKTDLDPGDMEEFVDYSGEGLHAFKDDYLDDGEEEFDLSDDNRDTDVSDGEDDDVAVAKKGKKGKGKKGKKEKGSGETFWDIFLRRAFVNSGHEYQLDFD